MPLLACDDPLPRCPDRVLVAGTSGSGKTTLAGRIGRMLAIPHVEIDGLFHGPGWTARPSFRRDVEEFTALPCWVTEWQYSSVRPLLLSRAELLAWLDLPVPTVMRQVTARTVRRRWRREELWNGNIEPPLRTILHDREHVVRWAWRNRDLARARVLAVVRERPDLPVVRLRSRREADAWLEDPLANSG